MALSPWLLANVSALVLASWLFLRTNRDAPPGLRVAYVRALPFTVLGALGVDYALAVLGYAVSGGSGEPPRPFGVMAYGALFGLGGAFALFARRRGFSVYESLDRITAPLALLVAVGRLGCTWTGCEHGRPTGTWLGVVYDRTSPHFDELVREGLVPAFATRSVPLHPAMLYEAAFALGACFLALALRPRPTTRRGGVFFAGTLVYAGGRIVSELFRADARAATFTTGQAMSVFVVALAMSLALRETDRRSSVTQQRGDAEPWPSSPPSPR